MTLAYLLPGMSLSPALDGAHCCDLFGFIFLWGVGLSKVHNLASEIIFCTDDSVLSVPSFACIRVAGDPKSMCVSENLE